MTILHAIILGLVQGLTEFIPVSSSGHLVLAQHFLGVNNFTFAVLLNFGTLLALVLYYRRKLWAIIHDIFINRNILLAAKLLAATIPTVIVGLLLGDFISRNENNIYVVLVMAAAVGLLMVAFGGERPGGVVRDTNRVSWKQTAVIGVAQMFALIPGTSRSGSTILAGLQQRLGAETAAEFSFMLAIPTILGASLKMLVSHEGQDFLQHNMPVFLVGNLVSFVSGFIAISFLIKLLGRRGLRPFGYYRLGLAALLAVLLLFKVI